MRDILVHGIIGKWPSLCGFLCLILAHQDTMTSPTSTAPYSLSDMQQMLSVMNSMRSQ